MATVRLALLPRDGLFFKDGRGWYTSASERGHALPWPFPSSVLGALRTAYGRTIESATQQALTPEQWLERTAAIAIRTMVALRRHRGEAWSPSHRMWSVPADAWYAEGARSVQRLDPIPRSIQTLGRDDDAAREALWRPDVPAGKPVSPPSFWTEDEWSAWLSGRTVPVLPPDDCKTRELSRRLDVRVQIDAVSGAVVEGAFFTTEIVETLQATDDGVDEWALGLEATLPDTATTVAAPMTLGSDRRLATVESLHEAMFAIPAGMTYSDAKGLRVVVVTPACFANGWLPDGFESVDNEIRGDLPGVETELILRAAYVPRAIHVSGWDMVAGQPKKTLRLVPPGAVYFFQKVDATPFTSDEMHGLWLRPWGQHQNEGFGRIVAGLWEVHGS